MTKMLEAIYGTPDRPLKIGDIEIPCYVLEGDIRVSSQRGLQTGIGKSIGGGSSGDQRMPRFIDSLAADRFCRSVQRAFPKLNSALELRLTDKEGEPL
jgi:hypothetical protein